ncbi:alpha/beta hydrolase [Acidisphaera sp. L21]|uniref:alpha/beta hydrolase n=1 Tax=Acidisphaera sp. L21 TaxID=1641851 RepID=UPI001C207D55|nr:alpha/beta hydrolase [Acidisphaera sp. L21]
MGSAFAAAGCSPVTILNNLAPSRLVADGVPYGPDPRQTLDVYAPGGAGPFPVVVFLYGGGWTSGDRAMYRFVGGALAARGFVVVVPDYRLFPTVRFPTFLQDNATALRWTRDHAAQYGGAPGPFFLMGHSAGAYNVAMLALDPEWLAGVGMSRSDLRGALGLAGPYDFLPLGTDELRAIFGPQDQLARTQPINFVDGHAPPMLLLAGETDTTVYPRNSIRLADRIRSAGGIVDLKLYPGIQHEEIVGAIGTPLRFLAPTLQDCVDFMRHPPVAPGGA